MLGPPAPFLPERWHGRPVCVVQTCWSGPADEDERVRAQLGDLGPVVGQYVERMPYPVINTLLDESLPAGLFHYWKGNFNRELTDGAIDVHLDYGSRLPSPQTATLIFPIDGACHRVAPDATAFAYRDMAFSTGIGPSFAGAADIDANVEWCRAYSDALRPHSEEAGYVNFLDADDQDRVGVDYRQNYDRLATVKRRYDPGNLFRLNHNIAP